MRISRPRFTRSRCWSPATSTSSCCNRRQRASPASEVRAHPSAVGTRGRLNHQRQVAATVARWRLQRVRCARTPQQSVSTRGRLAPPSSQHQGVPPASEVRTHARTPQPSALLRGDRDGRVGEDWRWMCGFECGSAWLVKLHGAGVISLTDPYSYGFVSYGFVDDDLLIIVDWCSWVHLLDWMIVWWGRHSKVSLCICWWFLFYSSSLMGSFDWLIDSEIPLSFIFWCVHFLVIQRPLYGIVDDHLLIYWFEEFFLLDWFIYLLIRWWGSIDCFSIWWVHFIDWFKYFFMDLSMMLLFGRLIWMVLFSSWLIDWLIGNSETFVWFFFYCISYSVCMFCLVFQIIVMVCWT